MDIGRLYNPVTIQESTETQSASGEPTQAWVKKYDVWSSVQQMSGQELFQADQVTPGATHKVKMRHCEGITTKMRVLFGTRELYIVSVNNVDERDTMLILICKENT